MNLYKYKDINHYYKCQKSANKRKHNLVWASPQELDLVAEFIKTNISSIRFGICHGVRTGWEVEYLRKKLLCNVIGTEIGETYKTKKFIINWDFHKVKDEWIGATDFIYSNSIDHSYDPGFCLSQWISCLSENGYCFIEWAPAYGADSYGNDVDPFRADFDEYKKIINDTYCLDSVIKAKGCRRKAKLGQKKSKDSKTETRYIFVIHRKPIK